MKNKMKKIISLVLVLAISFTISIPAFAKTKGSDAIIEQNNIYDLSNLDSATAYFQKHTEMLSYSSETLEKIINSLIEYREKINNNTTKKTISNLICDLRMNPSENTKLGHGLLKKANVSFNLQSKLDANVKAMNNTYNISYAAILATSGFNRGLAATGAYEATGIFFAAKEREGGDWDYKRVIGWDTPCKTYIDGRYLILHGEDVGNIHYGYVGSTYFPENVLKSAAGLVQIASGTATSDFSSYFDDPNDQRQIQRGINYYKTHEFR